jgi:hypothetical protein
MTSLGQYANGRTIECELLKATKIEGEIDLTELNTQSVSLEDKWKIYLDENDSFIIKNEIQNVISLEADGLTGYVTIRGGGGGGGATNLTDLQDVCGVALNGQMFYYNQVTGKYEFTNSIINDETNSRIIINDLSCSLISSNEISCNILNYNTLNPPISISTNLTDLQDVCATALNGQMFYYNQVTGKYEFTNSIINDETNSKIIINDLSCSLISSNEISCNILNYNTLNPPINVPTALTDLTDVCGTALPGDIFFYNATSGKYEFTDNIKNDIANNFIVIRNLHIEELGTSSATNKIISQANLDLSNNSLITDNIITSIAGLNIYTEGTGQNEPSLFLYKNIVGAMEYGGAKERLFLDAEDVFIGNDLLVKKDLICKDLSCENLTLTDINLTGDIKGGSILNIDPAAHGDETGLVVIKGNLQIDGSSTIINSSIVDISDIAILLAANAPNLSATDGAGIDVSGGASFKYKYSSGAFDTGHWESNIDLSCDLIKTQNIHSNGNLFISAPIFVVQNSPTNYVQLNHQNLGTNYITGIRNWISSISDAIHLDAFGTGHNSGIRIKNRGFTTTDTDTIFNYNNAGENVIRGSVNTINSYTSGLYLNAFGSDVSSTIKMLAEGTGTNSGVQIVNGAGGNGSTIFNYNNAGENYIRGTNLNVGVPDVTLIATTATGFIKLQALGTGANSGVQITNGGVVGGDTIFNHQNNGTNLIHGESRFFNDINVQTRLKVGAGTPGTGNLGDVLTSRGASLPNEWSNNPSLPNYLYMGALNFGVSGQVLVSQHPSGFPTWSSSPLLSGATFTGDVSFNSNIDVCGNIAFSNAGGGSLYSSATSDLGISLYTSPKRFFFNAGHPNRRFIMEDDTLDVTDYAGAAQNLYLNYNGGGVFFGYPPNQLSDDRIKFNESNITNGLEVIRKLSPEKYIKRFPNQTTGIEEAGFIAQEVLQIPELRFAVTHPNKEFIKGDPNTRYYTLTYDSVFTYAVAGLKELDTIVQQQAQLISSLEARLLELESR